ncbi:MAG TPA: GGDEF domain-containing protein [Steroidobacteraceae bacterium]
MRPDIAGARNPGSSMYRGRCSGALLVFLLLAWPIAASTPARTWTDLDRAEQLSWMDAPAGLRLLDELEPRARSGDVLIDWLMIRGLAYADVEREQAEAVAQRLHMLAATQPAAEAAGHIVKAYLYVHDDQFDRADEEQKLIVAEASLPRFERFRLRVLRGTLNTVRGRYEAAMSSYESARDLAYSMQSRPRVVETMIRLCALSEVTRNLDRGDSLVAQLRAIAQQTADETLLSEVADLEAMIASDRGDRVEEGRELREALDHARRGGSLRSLAAVYVNLGALHLKTHNYAAALDDSNRGLVIARKLRRPLFERILLYHAGLAQIGLGQLASGKRIVEGVLQQSQERGDLSTTRETMLRYREELERVGDLRGALEVWHREDAVRDRLAKISREKALLELSAKFDAEHRARQIERLERDNAIKSRDLEAQRLKQQMIGLAVALIGLACGVLIWGITRIRRINARLLRSVQHDPLTGLLDRCYFNERVLAENSNRPYVGCLLLIGLDELDGINDTWGYAGGERVLRAVSKLLSSTLHDSDALVRWAGDAFLVMTGPMSNAELNLILRRLLTAIHEEPVNWDGRRIAYTVSIGYASFPLKGAAVDITLDRAITLVDKALRQVRRRGGGRACLISLVNAGNERELSAINDQFEAAALERRVQLIETMSTAA